MNMRCINVLGLGSLLCLMLATCGCTGSRRLAKIGQATNPPLLELKVAGVELTIRPLTFAFEDNPTSKSAETAGAGSTSEAP